MKKYLGIVLLPLSLLSFSAEAEAVPQAQSLVDGGTSAIQSLARSYQCTVTVSPELTPKNGKFDVKGTVTADCSGTTKREKVKTMMQNHALGGAVTWVSRQLSNNCETSTVTVKTDTKSLTSEVMVNGTECTLPSNSQGLLEDFKGQLPK